MMLGNFLLRIFRLLEDLKGPWCVIRNYEGFPCQNYGNDIDILLRRSTVDEFVDAFAKIPGVQMTNLVRRHYVVSLHAFVKGLGGVQIDLVLALMWKGIEFLDTKMVLSKSRPYDKWPNVRVPAHEDEVLMMFFHSYLFGGFVKAKYWHKIMKVFREQRDLTVAAMKPMLGQDVAVSLVDAVIQGDVNRVMYLRNKVMYALIGNSIARSPMSTIRQSLLHHLYEVWVRLSRYSMMTVAILGPDGVGKSSVIELASKQLEQTAKIVDIYHLKPKVLYGKIGIKKGPVAEPHALPARGVLFSICKILTWVIEYWLDRIILLPKHSHLRLFDRYYDDLLVDPKRYRYGGPMWMAKFIAVVMPRPELWILLDAPAELVQKRKSEVLINETLRQKDEYLRLVRGFKNSVVIDASRPLNEVASEVARVIVDAMARRTAALSEIENGGFRGV